jgi:hypothetical protein
MRLILKAMAMLLDILKQNATYHKLIRSLVYKVAGPNLRHQFPETSLKLATKDHKEEL